MRLSRQIARALWLGLTLRLFCEGKNFAVEETGANLEGINGVLTREALLSEKLYKTQKVAPFQAKDEAEYEDPISEEDSEDENYVTESDAENGEGVDDDENNDNDDDDDDDDEGDDNESGENVDDKSDASADFDDADLALEALSEGILKSIKTTGGESYVPCFGMWWPASGGVGYYDYVYGDYGGGDYSTDDGGDYTDGRRRKRKRARRMRSRKKAAKRRRKRRRNKTA